MPRPHRKARRIIRDEEDDEEVQLVDDTESENEYSGSVDQTQMDVDEVINVDDSFESAVESHDSSRLVHETSIVTISDSPNSRRPRVTTNILDGLESGSETQHRSRSNSLESEKSSRYGTPPAHSSHAGSEDNTMIHNTLPNSLGIQVAHLEPVDTSDPTKSLNLSPTKQALPNNSYPDTNTVLSGSITPPRKLSFAPTDMPSLGPPPRTPERNVVDFSHIPVRHTNNDDDSDSDSDPRTNPANQSFGPDDVINLVTISPSKGRLRALEAEKEASQADKPKDPRLVITKLVLTDFKSYAGKQEIGPFDSVRSDYYFTFIVGVY